MTVAFESRRSESHSLLSEVNTFSFLHFTFTDRLVKFDVRHLPMVLSSICEFLYNRRLEGCKLSYMSACTP